MNRDRKPLPRFWYLPARHEGGRRHDRRRPRQRRHRRPLRQLHSRTARRAARWPTGSASAAPRTSTRHADHQRAGRRATRRKGFEIGAARQRPNCADFTPASLEADVTTDQLAAFAPTVPEPRRRPSTQPHALHRLERLRHAAARSSCAHGIRLDTNYYYWPATWVERRARACSPAPACRCASPTLDGTHDRRLPGDDADDRRVRPDATRSRSTRCSTARSAPRATTAPSPPTCTPTPPSQPGSDAIVASAQARGVPIVSARQMLTGSTAATARRSAASAWSGNTLELHASPQAAGRERAAGMVPTTSSRRRSELDHAQWHRGADDRPDDQGR